MTVHQRSVEVRASSAEVFHLFGEPQRLPEFCPAVGSAVYRGQGVVRLSPRALGGSDIDVIVERDPATLHVSWALLRRPEIRGLLIIQPGPDFAGEEGCIVTSIVEDGVQDVSARTRATASGGAGDVPPPTGVATGRPVPVGPAHAEGFAAALDLEHASPGEAMGRLMDAFRRYADSGALSRHR